MNDAPWIVVDAVRVVLDAPRVLVEDGAVIASCPRGKEHRNRA
jgi:hypothetical protein